MKQDAPVSSASERPGTQWGMATEAALVIMRPMIAVPIPAAGHPLSVQWNPVRGATRVVLDDGGQSTASAPAGGSVRIAPAAATDPLGTIALTSQGNHRIYSNPGRNRIKSLVLRGLKMTGDKNPVYKKQSDFSTPTSTNKILRLMVATRASASDPWMPAFAVPPLPSRGEVPSLLTGATFSNEVLTFPYAISGQMRLTLFEGDRLESLIAVATTVASVAANAELVPRDLELLGQDGQVIWAFPGEYPLGASASEPSLRVPIELALNDDLPAALAAGRPLRAEFRVKGSVAGAAAFITFNDPRGEILREHRGLLHVDLAGDPVLLPLAGEALDPQTPQRVSGGFSVRYLGLRLLAELSDPLPAPDEMVRGVVVRDAPLLRALPPAGLDGISVAMIGFIGRAPEECELEAQLVRFRDGVVGAPVGPPGRVVVLPSGGRQTTAWVDLSETGTLSEPLAVSVRSLRGRFFWAGEERPRIRVAIHDPDPGGRALLLGGQRLLSVNSPSIDIPEQNFPPTLFRAAAPAFASELFMSVDISDLILRYRRP